MITLLCLLCTRQPLLVRVAQPVTHQVGGEVFVALLYCLWSLLAKDNSGGEPDVEPVGK